MKEELQSKLVEILTSIQTAAGKASDFAMEQLPDIAQSYVTYGRVVETACAALWLASFCVALFVALRLGFFDRTAVHKRGHSEGEWLETRLGCAVVGSAVSVCMLLLAPHAVEGAALVWFAPKVWLLKEIATLLK